MTLSLHGLRALAATATAGSLTGAAAALGRTPSAVSMLLKQLEAEIGRPLFEGERKGTLTPTGRAVLAEAQAALDRFARAEAAIRAHASGAAGRLALAAAPSAAAHLLPRALADFRARFPAVAIDLQDADSARVAEEVVAGRVDLGIAGAPGDRGAVAFRPLFRDALGLVCRRDDPLAANPGPIGWDDLAGRTLFSHALSPAAPAGHAAPDGAVRARTVISALALVRAGLGLTILPRLTLPAEESALAFVEMAPGAAPPRTVGLLIRRGESLPAAADAFLGLLPARLDALARRLGGAFERLDRADDPAQ